MRTLVIGGAASGKSAFAENLAVSGKAPLCYIATMMPHDEESRARISKHREQRAQKSFATIECYTELDLLCLPVRGTVLLECIGNLTANEMFTPDGAGSRTAEAILCGFEKLAVQCDDLVVVSNDVFSDGCEYDEGTRLYMETIAAVNREVARNFDRVIEVVCGIPIVHKGVLT